MRQPGASQDRASRQIGRAASLLFLTGLLASLACSTVTYATDLDDAARENHLRAGYLFNFAKFVEWPALGSTDALTVCFAGATGVRDAFAAAFVAKQIGAHKMALRTLAGRDSTAGCHILYVEVQTGGTPRPPVAENSGVLTVGDQRDFIHQGGIVELFTDNNRLRFNINLALAHRAGLKISSSLLQLASNVEESAP